MLAKVSIRPANAADVAWITECVHQAYQHYAARIGRTPLPMLEDYAHVIAHREIFVAELGGEIIGVLVLAAGDENMLLENVAVSPKHQGKGFGRALLEFAESEAQRAGSQAVCLYTHAKMIENQSLYAKFGYVEFDRRTENGYDRVYMRKTFR